MLHRGLIQQRYILSDGKSLVIVKMCRADVLIFYLRLVTPQVLSRTCHTIEISRIDPFPVSYIRHFPPRPQT
jgi:hypothetical protein